MLPTERTMTNIAKHKRDSDHWYFNPFYHHPQGYKMSLRVDAMAGVQGRAHVTTHCVPTWCEESSLISPQMAA